MLPMRDVGFKKWREGSSLCVQEKMCYARNVFERNAFCIK